MVCGRRVRRPLCAGCLARTDPPPTTRVRQVGAVPALFAYAGHGARIVQALKFRDGRRLVAPLADQLADLLTRPGAPRPGAVTWVPTSPARRRERGFDQAELLALALGRRLGVPAVRALRRRPGPAQTGLDRAARSATAGFVARARPEVPLLVVDDVCTTGATLRAATGALRDRDVVVAGAAVVARTP